jgi:hypothetical protein
MINYKLDPRRNVHLFSHHQILCILIKNVVIQRFRNKITGKNVLLLSYLHCFWEANFIHYVLPSAAWEIKVSYRCVCFLHGSHWLENSWLMVVTFVHSKSFYAYFLCIFVFYVSAAVKLTVNTISLNTFV